jgi:hypothetical protein
VRVWVSAIEGPVQADKESSDGLSACLVVQQAADALHLHCALAVPSIASLLHEQSVV